MSLSTAGYMTRAKEVGLRKVMGAERSKLVKQFLGESILISFIALPLGIFFFEFISPQFTSFFNDPYKLSLWGSPRILVLLAVITVIAGIISGLYPAVFLSAFKPVLALKGYIQAGKAGMRFRKILVVTQFSAAALFIVFAIVIRDQFTFMVNLDLGYNRDRIIVLPLSGVSKSQVDIMKEKLSTNVEIINVSAAHLFPIKWQNGQNVIPDGGDDSNTLSMDVMSVDYNFIETLGMNINEGRSFSKDYNEENSFIINETAVKTLNWENPVGRKLVLDDKQGTIVGIAKDFHFRNLFTGIAPAIMYISSGNPYYMYVKYSPFVEKNEITAYLENIWNESVPGLPFEYSLLEDDFLDAYSDNDKAGTIIGIIGFFTILISCLGLLGLIAYNVDRKRKEIGVRKVLGATEFGIVKLILSDLFKLLVVSNFIAFPLSYFLLRWILDYAFVYTIDIEAGVFVFTLLLLFSTSTLVVAAQTFRAARSNPVDSIRCE
jgi:putative ABC transport system permease protein